MTADAFLEMAPLAALDALDGEDRRAFEAHVAGCPACAAEVAASRETSGLLAWAVGPVAPAPSVRQRVLASLGTDTDVKRPARRDGGAAAAAPVLAWAAAILLGMAATFFWAAWDGARTRARLAQEAASQASDEAAARRQELAAVRATLEEERSLRDVLAQPGARVAALAGLKDAPRAHGQMAWNPASGQAVLVAAGLDPLPAGKAYEVWVIAGAAPVPAGLFRPDADGRALFRLPALSAAGQARTFAVTVEPAAGTAAPTGPMVLAGAAS